MTYSSGSETVTWIKKSISITWEVVRNANCWAPPHSCLLIQELRGLGPVFSKALQVILMHAEV